MRFMGQAGRYMAAFREYSEKYKFRERSETPDMAIALSMQVSDTMFVRSAGIRRFINHEWLLA